MVLTRCMVKRSEFLNQRVQQARALIALFESNDFEDTEWTIVFGRDSITKLPSCLKELGEQCVCRHEVFNWKTGDAYCEGWQWVDIMSILCKDLNVNVEYEGAIGRGTTQRRYGNAALCALKERVKE